MALARYKDLCIDASDAHALTEFWAATLGWEAHPHDDGNGCIRVDGAALIWVNSVPEPTSVKNRLHLDVRAESLDAMLAGGAVVVDQQPGWTVMRDPDGQEFCAFVRDAPVGDRAYELGWDVTGDVAAAHRVATWWAQVLGGEVVREEGWTSVEGIDGLPFESLVFQPVPEDKRAKNRIHIDVTTDDLRALVAEGAMPTREKGDDGIGWTVMVDPAGNEFCAFITDE
ncbi:MAG: VOC family protein [Humibacillus sp.]